MEDFIFDQKRVYCKFDLQFMCHYYISPHERSGTVFSVKINQYRLMKGMFFNGQYMKLFNSYFYYHLNFDFVLDGNVSQKNKNKWRTFKKKKMIKIIRVPSRAIR